MTQYIVKYYWPKNHHEVYSFVCWADNIEHAIEQCEDAYPNNCHILSVDIFMNDIVFDDKTMSNMKKLSDIGVLKPLAELIEKLNLDEEDVVILNKLINKHLENN